MHGYHPLCLGCSLPARTIFSGQEIGGMEYTIIRPGGLKNEAGTGQGIMTENSSVCGAIHREDVADLVIKALFSSKTNGKVIESSCCMINVLLIYMWWWRSQRAVVTV